MSFHINDEKLLESCKAIWTKIKDLRNIELNSLPAYDDKYIKTEKERMVIIAYYFLRFKCARWWCKVWIFYSHFYWFFTCLWKQIWKYMKVYLDNKAYKI